ncbi:MAG: glucose-6-phosphate dehydrogenase [Candidatus Peribacter sp.]|nr:glucose-6-phosphate dehydrogenase [Candidatus Peribacter sp.]
MKENSRNNIPTIIVVLGATGDLMAKKIIPSLLHLSSEDKIPNKFRVVGFARRDLTDAAFREHVASIVAEHKAHHGTDLDSRDFLKLFSYHSGDFEQVAAYRGLQAKLQAIDNEWGVCTNKVYYLAVPPEKFASIFEGLAATGLNKPCGGAYGWTRMLIEKPFGHDLATAEKLEKLLSRYFQEEQIYRIDHYLAKELIQGISHFRFSNNLLESSWSNRDIEKIEIRLLESIGVETRGSFYESVGALKDVGQNHVLEMLAAITMDAPVSMSIEELHEKRAELMNTLKPWTPEDIRQDTYRAQYDGYRAIKGVRSDSTAETYFKLKTELLHPSWRGVPIILEAGKRCPSARKEIVVTFKHPHACLMCSRDHRIQNRVVFALEPEEKISIHFWTKKSGYEHILEERTFDFFVHKRTSHVKYVEEYSKLIFSCILGDQTVFLSPDEVRAQWRFADPIVRAWEQNVVPLHHYKPDSAEMFEASASIGTEPKTATLAKEMAIIGLGKMGANMSRRMMEKGWRVVGFNRSSEITKTLAKEGMEPAMTLQEAVQKLPDRKIVWLMVPAGQPVDDVLFGTDGLSHILKRGDIVIDGGNSYYKDTVARAKKLHRLGIRFLDCGTSGGPNGARGGACLMIGGERKDFEDIEALFRDFAAPNSYQFFPGHGAGHFVKMVHNGIEYGMMQAIGEGFALMKKSPFKLDLTRVADVYNHGSVIESRLIGWLEEGFQLYGQDLKPVSGSVQQLGEGAWTVKTAKQMKIPVQVIESALKFRFASEKHPSFTGRIVSALRNRFGGHAVQAQPKKKRAG